jgi:hypothetical protein
MAKTLLTFLQNAADELGVAAPAYVIGNSDQQIRQLLALANREGKDFVSLEGPTGGWPQLRKTYTFNLQPGVDNYALPSDYQTLIPGTVWDGAYRWQIPGPINPQEWNTLKYGIVTAAPFIRFKIEAGRFYVTPVPGTAQTDTIAYAYESNAWCQSAGGTAQTAWAADTDTYLLDEECFILGIKRRFKSAKGLEYSQEDADYRERRDRMLATAGGSRMLPLNAGRFSGTFLLNYYSQPETGYGGGT